MRILRTSRQFLSRHLPLVLAGLCVTYFGFHAAWGDRGLVRTAELEQRTAERRAMLAELEQSRLVLQRRVDLIRGPEVDADLLDEQARQVLGWSRPEDIIIIVE